MMMLSKKVRERNIKVVITGEGADEFFGGYNIFKEAKIRRFWAREPNSKIRPKLLSRLYPYLPMMKDANTIASKMFFGYKLTETDDPFYSHLIRWNNTSRIKSFFSDDVNEKLKDTIQLKEWIGNFRKIFRMERPGQIAISGSNHFYVGISFILPGR